MSKLCHTCEKPREGQLLGQVLPPVSNEAPSSKFINVWVRQIPEVLDAPWNYKVQIPLFSLKNKINFVLEHKVKNTVFMVTSEQAFDLTNSSAPIFAIFGY